jgi:hypothetical protein
MSSTIPIQDLPSAASPLNGAAYVVIKDGATDKKATVTQIRAIDLSALTLLPSSQPVASDNMMVGRGSTTYRVAFTSIGLLKNTKCWFYQNTAPSGWAVDPTASSDALIAVKGGSNDYNASGGTYNGQWQQAGATLTVLQIPNHQHWTHTGSNQSNSNANYVHGAKDATGTTPRYNTTAGLGIVGGKNDAAPHTSFGGCDPHNHGSTWRPLANLGIVCYKLN